MKPNVEVRNVSKIFGKSPKAATDLLKQGKTKKEILKETGQTVGVNNVNFEIYPGEIFVIMGLSGSGKSTLIRMFNRLIDPTLGEILIDDEDIVKMNAARLREVRQKKISMVFQNFALFPHKTILENAEFGLEIQKVDPAKRHENAMRALEAVGLKGYENQMPSQLSGGMQQRVGLARALASDTDILLMDEAFSALDPLIRKDMQDELIQIQDQYKKTIIFITHDLDEALRIGDRIALMKDGSVIQLGTPEQIMMNPANEFVEKFVEDVDLSKVLTASHVMIRPEKIAVDRGPRVALEIMRKQGYSSIFVVDRKQKLLGAVTAEQARQAMSNDQSISEVMTTDIPTVKEDELLGNLMDVMATSSLPISVIDDQNRIKGILLRGAVIGALAGNKDSLNEMESE
ncbi:MULTISPECIES: glycine betaine/L-proline ABC transporter ATP-binding protein [unclassified Bacillus (in: firmicutes)]|uniref:quaternary amine ABC transporter ATP-binding protein n=1 Tax=unclassified Bacillus (in: firmicutes) TaxID=185979 RepID=UPI001BEC597C|nr:MULTISPECIES: glycine betaine/L-proline ABC transporter ATP-binding protein [unclassified Bacillus (in: firmicutes)]MBT2617008.1 glycine betaine/L-proline ABC transporter ATP-binding protein [Bacillus sp. ISL-78]MBT2630501.1 glycine betaine/L-proline ABC transporter ATP-binding protein [Bacillus sp. ISL-101]MBT2716510.1 glycine betaine/L-proline ABC transporter ATP-binding protein [Bacillus sp. ISL-57]